ncbi:hypothetical protein ACWF94_04215 [Streptomyces sp. NPDC055078]
MTTDPNSTPIPAPEQTSGPVPPTASGPDRRRSDDLGTAVGVLALLVVHMLAGAVIYLSYQHPKVSGPLATGAAFLAVAAAVTVVVYRRR